MKQGFRQSMAAFHTWAGLIMGWVVFVMFASGTCAYFQEEITRWMQPEVTQAGDQASAADGAARWLEKNAAGSTDWYITLPGKRSATTSLFWTPVEGAPEGAPNQATLDGSGNPVEARDTAGGFFLYRFHFDLRYMPVIVARYIVGIAAMFMLMAILSGIVTHKKIFVDFFTLRFGKGQRSWLDAHNVTAVLALPFYLMITYTGLVTLDNQLMPGPIAAVYKSPNTFFEEGFPQASGGTKSGVAAPLAPLSPMIEQARAQWGGADMGYIYVSNPGDSAATVTLTSAPDASINARGNSMTFDGVTGKVKNAGAALGAAQNTEGVMIGLHAGRYADTVLRWLYFLSGLGGTVMIATGLVLWTVKRRMKLPDPAKPYLGFRIVERLNIAVLIGFPIGLACYFLANRLLPLTMAERADWEVHCLFIAWGAVSVVALIRPARRAQIELSFLCALLFAAVPVVSGITTGHVLLLSLWQGDWIFAGFDLMTLVTAAAFALLGWKLAKRPATASGGKRRRKQAMAQ